jgi:toxin ParE1/3/4
MAAFRFSRRAEADLLGIGRYTLRKWGKAQTSRYLSELEASCQTLAENPALGRACDDIRPGLRRLEHGKHVIFYRQEPAGILVSRILHQSMLPGRHDIGDPSEEP